MLVFEVWLIQNKLLSLLSWRFNLITLLPQNKQKNEDKQREKIPDLLWVSSAHVHLTRLKKQQKNCVYVIKAFIFFSAQIIVKCGWKAKDESQRNAYCADSAGATAPK